MNVSAHTESRELSSDTGLALSFGGVPNIQTIDQRRDLATWVLRATG